MIFQDLEYVFSGSSDGLASIRDPLAVFNTLYFLVLVLNYNMSMLVSFLVLSV